MFFCIDFLFLLLRPAFLPPFLSTLTNKSAALVVAVVGVCCCVMCNVCVWVSPDLSQHVRACVCVCVRVCAMQCNVLRQKRHRSEGARRAFDLPVWEVQGPQNKAAFIACIPTAAAASRGLSSAPRGSSRTARVAFGTRGMVVDADVDRSETTTRRS